MFKSGVISKADYEQAAYQVQNAKQTLNQEKPLLHKPERILGMLTFMLLLMV